MEVMSEVLHADIFFFITGIAVIVCSAILCVALFHAIKVLKSMRRIMARIEEGTEVIAEDMHHVREFFTQEGFLARLFATLTGGIRRGGSRSQRSRAERKGNELKIKDEA
jgi:hypothetical protein